MNQPKDADRDFGSTDCSTVSILFLDIDGVLVNRRSLAHASGMRAKADADCVAMLNRITDATGARIVVSSTWRCLGVRRVKELLRLWGVSGRIIGCTPVLGSVDRGEEIQAYLDEYKKMRGAVSSFVILDDDDDMLHLAERLVQTQFAPGLTLEDADRAIAMLRAA